MTPQSCSLTIALCRHRHPQHLEPRQREGVLAVLPTCITHLMLKWLARPVCCRIGARNRMASPHKTTDKEIGETHNFEKTYVNGVFDE